MNPKDILIPLVTVGFTVTLNAIINTKIKFAATHDHAIKDIKWTLLLIAFWLSQAYLAWLLFLQLSSDAPLSRHSLALILMLSFGLFHTYLMYWFLRISNFQRRTLDIIDRMNEHTGKHIEITKEVIGVIKSQPDKSPEPTVVSAVSASEKSQTIE